MRELSNSGKFAMPKAHEIETPSERCRICRCSFKVKFGAASLNLVNLVISFQTINMKRCTRRNPCRYLQSSWIRSTGRQRTISGRVCSSCAHKILFELVLSSIGSGAAAFKTPPKQRIINASKRLVETPPGQQSLSQVCSCQLC